MWNSVSNTDTSILERLQESWIFAAKPRGVLLQRSEGVNSVHLAGSSGGGQKSGAHGFRHALCASRLSAHAVTERALPMVEKVEKIWLNGDFVPWDEAKVHVLTHTLHYGLGVFEGIRCYRRSDGRSAVFRLREHVDRLFDSAHISDMAISFSRDEITEACLELVRVNRLDECYIRPLAFLGEGAMGLYGKDNPVLVTIAAWRWGAYLGEEGLEHGIRAKVSSYTRSGINATMTKAKIVGNYVNSILAKREVVAAGYQEAIMLDAQGYVAEASGENVFAIKHGRLITPSVGGSILAGITRASVLTLANELGLTVEERAISRDELYVADELFFTGTAAEVTPVREVDERKIGDGRRGPITKRVQDRYFQLVRGPELAHPDWLSFVEH
jgi:branched-chain amino acid aminotransferase